MVLSASYALLGSWCSLISTGRSSGGRRCAYMLVVVLYAPVSDKSDLQDEVGVGGNVSGETAKRMC
jgi:hypothetical protein